MVRPPRPPDPAAQLILSLSRSSPFRDPTRPPMEEGGGADEIGPALEDDAPLRVDVFQFVDRREVAVDGEGVAWRPVVGGGRGVRRAGGAGEVRGVGGGPELS